MAEFKQRLDTTGGFIILNFTRIYTARGIIYFTVAVVRDVRFNFHMERRNGEWKLVESPKPPDWFLPYEAEVGKMIEEKESV